jgi:hypothetical protein
MVVVITCCTTAPLWLTFERVNYILGNATQPGEKDIEKSKRRFSEWMASSNGQRKLQSDTPVRVSVYVHVITALNGTRGNVSAAAIATQMEILDASYQPYFVFDLVKTDYTNNDSWHKNALSFDTLTPRSEMKEALHQGGPASLNLYIAGTTNTDLGVLLGLATFPDEYETAYVLRFALVVLVVDDDVDVVEVVDVVVGCCCRLLLSAVLVYQPRLLTITIDTPCVVQVRTVSWFGTEPCQTEVVVKFVTRATQWSMKVSPSGPWCWVFPSSIHNADKTGILLFGKVGHWLGLYHTFQALFIDGCVEGDFVDDTAQQAIATVGCPFITPDTCPTLPGNDPIENCTCVLGVTGLQWISHPFRRRRRSYGL